MILTTNELMLQKLQNKHLSLRKHIGIAKSAVRLIQGVISVCVNEIITSEEPRMNKCISVSVALLLLNIRKFLYYCGTAVYHH